MNIKFYMFKQFITVSLWQKTAPFPFLKNSPLFQWVLSCLSLVILVLSLLSYQSHAFSQIVVEPIRACVIAREVNLDDSLRAHIANCLGWEADPACTLCLGFYKPIEITPIESSEAIHIQADEASLYLNDCSTLSGNVNIQQSQKMINAQTAKIYRDGKTGKVTKIELLGGVQYLEPDRMMIASKAIIDPDNKAGITEDVLYRFRTEQRAATLPAWGRARLIQRFANQDWLMRQATYTTCAPQDKFWDIQADSITLDNANARGVARNAKLRIHEWPILYAPYLSFPTSNERKSGFLMPLIGYSNIGGMDLGLPYYWNIAPNQDATFLPHLYTKRGFMAGGEYRFLTSNSSGIFNGTFLPHDTAYADFLHENEGANPALQGNSTNRWSFGILESTSFSPNLHFNASIQRVSDDYYLQDFSTNLALITQRQLLQQADLTYTNDHWIVRGMGQGYQTLHPLNESFISNVYSRLPQVMAQGFYYDLPGGAQFDVVGQYDQFRWPSDPWELVPTQMPQGPRLHINPALSLPINKSWAYFTPSAEFVENYYQVQNNLYDPNNILYPAVFNQPFFRFSTDNLNQKNASFNRFIPRFSMDSGLIFERDTHVFGDAFIQTLEPRLFYLYVPYQNQTLIPVYDSGYMIFNFDQLFRTNRFSGFDRIGDANQLSYAVTTRWLNSESGAERANFSIGLISYFSKRKVTLCQSISGNCLDNPLTFGYTPPNVGLSPIATRGVYYINPAWGLTGDYVWDTATRSTNNSNLNVHYQPNPREIINFGYSYLVNGDTTRVRGINELQNNALHQATFAYAWPLNDQWSSVGVYSHNISKNYSMMSLGGVQYESCCWAMRLLAGRTFQSLDETFQPRYNSNIYFQILLKGLGSVATSDPASILHTFIPGYDDLFHH